MACQTHRGGWDGVGGDEGVDSLVRRYGFFIMNSQLWVSDRAGATVAAGCVTFSHREGEEKNSGDSPCGKSLLFVMVDLLS